METNYEIPSVPVSSPNINDHTGLKNLAGWIARYKEFGLKISEVSPFVYELFEKGILAQFEPSLTGIRTNSGSEEDFDRYEFDVMIEDFVNIDDNNWVILHFSFQANHCMMFVESCNQSKSNQSKVDKISSVMENTFNAIDVEPLLEEEFSRNITWQEADDTILKYLEYMKNPKIPLVPE